MINVSKSEAQIIRKTFSGDEGKIVSTMVTRSSRGKSYAVETSKVKALLCQLRGVTHID